MMWNRKRDRSLVTYDVSDGGDFFARVCDHGSHFSVESFLGAKMSVRGNSLDTLKLAVANMAINEAQGLEVAS